MAVELEVGELVRQVGSLLPGQDPLAVVVGITEKGRVRHKHINEDRERICDRDNFIRLDDREFIKEWR